MDKKITAIIVVIIVVIAAVAAYMALGNNGGDDNSSSAHAVVLDGVEASEDNVLNGTYPISRNLVLVTDGEPTGNVKAFLDWVTSADGQAIVGTEFVTLPEDQQTTYADPDPNGQTTIDLGGSTSLSAVAEELAKAYMEKYDYMTVTVAGGGSGVGESGTIAGDFDVGMLSRDLSAEGEADGLVPLQIGQDGVAVIVNVDGVEELTMEQVAAIFSGEIDNWSEVGGPDMAIAVIVREDGSGTRDCFDSAMEGVVDGWTLKSEVSIQNSTGNVINQVSTLEGSIGYISIGQLGSLTGDDTVTGAHALVLDGVEASEDNVLNGTYPISRNLVLVTDGEPTGNVKAFLDWVTSADGQAIVGTEFVTLPEDQQTTYADPDPNGQTTIDLGGSTSLSAVAEELAKAYMEKYDYMTVTVAGGGSGVGESGTIAGDFDVGMLSRDLSAEGEADGLVPLQIGQDGVAVIVNVDGVEELTMEQVAAIFSGEIDNWSEVGGPDMAIAVIVREDGSGTRDCFDSAMEGVVDGWTLKSEVSIQNSTGNVINQVSTLEGSIGYISIGQLGSLNA